MIGERLLAILERERRASAQNLRDVHALPVEDRVVAGDAVRGLDLLERGPGGAIQLRCAENLSRFRAGDMLWLGCGEDIEAGIAVVFRDHDPRSAIVHVEEDRFTPGGRIDRSSGLVLDRREIDLSDRMTDAVRALFDGNEHAAARALLLGTADAGATPRAEAVADETSARRAGLDPSQAAAFVAACTRPFSLVQGPPGAGKTRLAAEIVRAFLCRGRSVVVSAFTHRAVNNLLRAIAISGAEPGAPGPFRVVKIGSAQNADDLSGYGVERIPTVRGLKNADGPVAVGVTTHAAAGLLGRRFDLALIDEAGQVSLAQACAVLPLARRHVFVGDHKQLPPLVVAEHRDPLAHVSVFEHLHERYGSAMLHTTWRMNAELCAFPSQAFYGGLLAPADAVKGRRLVLARDAGPELRPDPPGLLVPMNHRGARTLAPDEAEAAADLVARAVAAGLDPKEAAVIAPHRAQGSRIRAHLRERLDHLAPHELPVVDTVERLQGGERDLIVLSLTGSDPDALSGDARFFFSENRLNVSLTRARKKLVILGSDALLDAFPDDPRALRGADLLRRMWRAYA